MTFMKLRYGLHPEDLRAEETERYYEEMAARGWQLVRRGALLSRFRRTEPRPMQYRAVLAQGGPDGAISAERLESWKRAGWDYVDSCGFTHIFAARPQTPPVDFTLAPEERDRTVKYLRRSLWFSAAVLVLALVWGAFALGLIGANTPERVLAQLIRTSVQAGGTLLLCAAAVVLVLLNLLGEMHLTAKILRRMKNGGSERLPARSHWKAPKLTQLAVLAVCVLCMAAQWLGGEKTPMPEQTGQPYLTLSELGVEGTRVPNPFRPEEESQVTRYRTLRGEFWECREFLKKADGDAWMFQEFYRLKSPQAAEQLAWALMTDAQFGDREAFRELEIPGLDCAFTTDTLEAVAVKDSQVLMITVPMYDRPDGEAVLRAVAKQWNRA